MSQYPFGQNRQCALALAMDNHLFCMLLVAVQTSLNLSPAPFDRPPHTNSTLLYMPPKPTVPIAAEDSVWPDDHSELVLPHGVTKAQALAKHSMPHLLTNFDPASSPVQLVAHRGLPDYAKAIPDNCMPALQKATAGEREGGGNLVELDPLWIRGEPYVMHDMSGDRQTLVQGPWSEWIPEPKEEMPKYIVRNVEGSEFTEKYFLTDLRVTHLEECIRDILSRNPAATLFLDGRDSAAAELVALISRQPAYQNNVLVQVYPYVYPDGSTFESRVNNVFPHADSSWKETVAILPVLNPDTLPILAHLPFQSDNYSALYNAGKQWIISMVETKMRVFGLGFPLSGIGHSDRVNLGTNEFHDLAGNLVVDHRVKSTYLQDRVLLDLATWAKRTYPSLAIVMVSITYGWPRGAASQGRELMAIPGNPVKHGAHIVICDRMTDNLNALLHTKAYAWPDNIDYPAHDVTPVAFNITTEPDMCHPGHG
ncbi:hypothetical protein JVU11DRAFT_8372 [Chiua virens]|nr:hypothetical protein JVU11DRAFT_8372 [Chiua virens]